MAHKGSQIRRYSPKEREAAIALAEKVGNAAAARELGIPMGTVGWWRAAHRKSVKSATAKPAVEPSARQGKSKRSGEAQTAVASGASEPAARVVPTQKPASARRVARVYTPSQKAEALAMLRDKGPAQTSRELGISRFSLHEWNRQQQASEHDSAVDSPIAGPDIDKVADRDGRILQEWAKHPGLGPSQIRNQLRRGGFKVSVRTTRMVMQQHGYVPPKVKRVQSHDRRYEAVRPNHLWHLDFMQRHIHKQKISVLFLVDDYSRYIPGFAIWDEDRSEAVLECFESAVSRHGRPETVMSDGGAAFWSWRGVSRFTRLLEEMEVDQIVAKTPEVNGKLEVLNANVQKELFNQERFFSLGEAQSRLRAWVSFYNFGRTHHALGGLLVPADRYFGRADEVLAQIEAGRSAEGVGEPIPVGDRQLDLLRVSSRAGKLELLLMGERIWPQSCAP